MSLCARVRRERAVVHSPCSRLAAVAVADGLLALAVGPARAVADHVAELAGEQPAHDLPHRIDLLVAQLPQPGADVVPEAEVAGGGLGAALARGRALLAVLAAASRRSASRRPAPAK